MFGSLLRDKDGVAASVVFAEFVASLQRQGKTASSRLQELYTECVYLRAAFSAGSDRSHSLSDTASSRQVTLSRFLLFGSPFSLRLADVVA